MDIRTGKMKSSWQEMLMTALGMLWLGLFPLWHDGSYTRITRAKWLAMLVLTGVTVLTMLVVLAGDRKRRVRLHPAQALGLGYLAWVSLSAWLGSMAGQLNSNGQLTVLWGAVRYEGLMTQGCYAAIFLLMSLMRTRLRPVLTAAAAAVLICFGVMALQYTGSNPFRLFPEGLNVGNKMEFQGTIGNIDILSAWLCLAVPILVGGWLIRRGSGLCLAAGLAGVMMQLCIQVQSGLIALTLMVMILGAVMLIRPEYRSRGWIVMGAMAWVLALQLTMEMPWETQTQAVAVFADLHWRPLAVLTGGCLCGIMAYRAAKNPGRAVRMRWAVWGAVLSIVLGLAAIYVLPMPENTGMWELREVLRGRAQDTFGSERLGVWRLTLEMSGEHWLFGTGPDTFLYALRDYMAQTGQYVQQNFDNPHNIFLGILANSGLPALLFFLALLGLAGRAALRRPEVLMLGMGLTGYLTQGMFTFSICLSAPMFWAVLGMLIALDHEERTNKE